VASESCTRRLPLQGIRREQWANSDRACWVKIKKTPPRATDLVDQRRGCEAEVNRIAGEIALLSPEPDAAIAQTYFERALAVARTQQAKSWELRAAMSMARLWRDQGQAGCGPRSSRSGLWLVHRRLRHARSERGEGAAR
jgi:hypothetical protein